jgi:hypothetical protein
MTLLLIVSSFLSGLLICNALPHLAAGLRGESFPTPFAKPPGIGLSPPLVNVVWGWFALFLGLAIMPRLVFVSAVMPLLNLLWLSFALGFLLSGVYLAWHFGKAGGKQS